MLRSFANIKVTLEIKVSDQLEVHLVLRLQALVRSQLEVDLAETAAVLVT